MTWDKKHIDIKLINFGKTFGDVLGTCAVSYHHLICTISMFLYLFFFSGSARAGGKGPIYKDPESYYDEIQSLKRVNENVILYIYIIFDIF